MLGNSPLSGTQSGLLGSLLGSLQQMQPTQLGGLGGDFGASSFRDHRQAFDKPVAEKKLSFLPALRQEIDNWIKL